MFSELARSVYRQFLESKAGLNCLQKRQPSYNIKFFAGESDSQIIFVSYFTCHYCRETQSGKKPLPKCEHESESTFCLEQHGHHGTWLVTARSLDLAGHSA